MTDVQGVTNSRVVETAMGTLVTFRDPDNIQLELFFDLDTDADGASPAAAAIGPRRNPTCLPPGRRAQTVLFVV